MTLTSKQLGSIALVIALGVIGMMVVNAMPAFAGPAIIIVAIAAAAALVMAGGGGGATGLEGLGDAIRRASAGERPSAPASASPEVSRLYDELSSMAERTRKQESDFETKQSDLLSTEQTLEEVTGGSTTASRCSSRRPTRRRSSSRR